MSELRCVELQRLDNGIRVLSLARPPVNALGRELVEDLESVLRTLGEDDAARSLVLRSAGKHFCAGADLKERREMSKDDIRAFVPRLSALCTAIAGLPFPSIASIRGAAAGGGCELALACDIRVVADDATIGLRETALAIIPGAGGTQRLPRIIGPSRAKQWIFTGRMHTADEALADGVANLVVLADRLEEETREIAEAIAANGPLAVRLAKQAVDRGFNLPLDQGLATEWELYQKTLDSEDRLEALNAFAGKRSPVFEGR